MIELYSGTPGSGKSLHVAKIIYNRLNMKTKNNNVIANFPINEKMIKKKKSNFIYLDNSELTPNYLINYAKENHQIGVENQCLVVVDECQIIWNSRDWQQNQRMEWIEFFTQHRKYGYNFIAIAQNDRMIDRQIRSLFEYNVIHRKVNNFKIGTLFPFPLFIAVTYWYGVKEKLSSEFFIYRKKWSKFYNSFKSFKVENAEQRG